METAIFAGGCFWCTEAIFKNLRGVSSVIPGYTGGDKLNPTYEDVCSGESGHAEGIKIEFDPNIITYEALLEVFFATHDPTTLNQQGADHGTQYRSAIFPTTPEQEKVAIEKIAELNKSGEYASPVVTSVEKFTEFFVAEDYHKNFFENHKNTPYCQIVINPKLTKLRAKFGQLLNGSSS